MSPDLNDIRSWIAAAAPGGGLVSDSRRVQPGDVFLPIRAMRRMAAASLAPLPTRAPPPSCMTTRTSPGLKQSRRRTWP